MVEGVTFSNKSRKIGNFKKNFSQSILNEKGLYKIPRDSTLAKFQSYFFVKSTEVPHCSVVLKCGLLQSKRKLC